MDVTSLTLLALLLIANGSPVIIRYFLKERCNFPLDGGIRFIDGRPLLGRSKTVMGMVVAVAATGLAAPLFGVAIATGAAIGLWAMAGDAMSSFIKRRLHIEPSGSAPVLDQVPESLLPAVMVGRELITGWHDVVAVVAAFTVINLVVSRLLVFKAARRR